MVLFYEKTNLYANLIIAIIYKPEGQDVETEEGLRDY